MLPNLLATLALVAASGAIAQDASPDADHRFFVRGGAFFTDMTTTVLVDSFLLPGDGTTISFEDDVGLAEGRTVPNVEGGWRFARDWRLTFEYFAIDRRQTATLERTIIFDESQFDVGAEVSGRFASKLYKMQVGWSPLLRDNAELGLSLGVHLTDFTVGIAGEVSVAGEGTVAGVAEERRDVLAPLPNFGAYGRFDIVDDVSIVGRVNYFEIRIDAYKGGITDGEIGLMWKFHPNFGVGGAYRVLNYRLDIDEEDYRGIIRYRFHGPQVYAIVTF